MEKKYGKSTAQQLSNPRNYISRSQADAMGLGTEREIQQQMYADIKKTVESAPEGTYDPQYWNQFLALEPYEIPKNIQFIRSDDPEILSALYKIPSAVSAMEYLATVPYCQKKGKCSQAQKNAIIKEKRIHQTTVALNVNRLMMEKNAPLIQAVEKQQRQKEIDQAVQLAMEQKIRETAKATPEPEPEPTPEPEPEPTPAVTSSLPIIPIIIIAVIVGIFLLRRRA